MLTEHLDNFVWPSEFACTLITEKLVLPNHYTVKLSVEPTDPKTNDVNLGFKKIRYFIDCYLNNSILVNQENPIVKSLTGMDSNLVLMPVEPFDYFFASILYLKLVTISERYFHINHLTVDSIIGDRVQYTITHDNDIGVDLRGNFWWNMDSVNTGTDDHTSWQDLNLKDSPRFSPIVVKGGLSEN
jgi:hypothetical protein